MPQFGNCATQVSVLPRSSARRVAGRSRDLAKGPWRVGSARAVSARHGLRLSVPTYILAVTALEKPVAGESAQHPTRQRIREAEQRARLIDRDAKAGHLFEFTADAKNGCVPLGIGQAIRATMLPGMVHCGVEPLDRPFKSRAWRQLSPSRS